MMSSSNKSTAVHESNKNNNSSKSKSKTSEVTDALKKKSNRFSTLTQEAVRDFNDNSEIISGEAVGSWADRCEAEDGGLKKEDAQEVHLFTLINGQAPFLVGVKGRNISLIRKFSGMAIYIKNDVVSMIPQRSNANPGLAWRMVLSACYGGILRWFDTPNATKKGYPADKVDYCEKLAAAREMTIDLLRSKRGHMCLMLVPQVAFGERPTDQQIADIKDGMQAARQELLSALQPSSLAEP